MECYIHISPLPQLPTLLIIISTITKCTVYIKQKILKPIISHTNLYNCTSGRDPELLAKLNLFHIENIKFHSGCFSKPLFDVALTTCKILPVVTINSYHYFLHLQIWPEQCQDKPTCQYSSQRSFSSNYHTTTNKLPLTDLPGPLQYLVK